MDSFSKFTAAAVQAAPVFLDRKATVAKACALIEEAGSKGAKIIAFPEVFIPGYPYWNWMMSPLDGSPWMKRLYMQSVDVPGPDTDALCQAAHRAGVYVVIGVNERSPISLGVIYNTNLVISPQGTIIGRHRKLVPTFAEKLTWTSGDGSSIRVYPTEYGRLGTLACGENTNTLARFALLSQGELVHVANYIAFPFVQHYDMPDAIKIRAGAHSFEGKVYTLVACSAMTPEIVDMLARDDKERKMMTGRPSAFTGMFGPTGQMITDPLIDEEGIVYGEIDLGECVLPKQYQDIIGHYNRFDIFDLRVNRRPLGPVRLIDPAIPEAGEAEGELPGRDLFPGDDAAGRGEAGVGPAGNPPLSL